MIIIELNGGLGNQMFQYAAAFVLARKNGVQLKIDLSHLTAWHMNKNKKWDPEILKLNISSEVCTNEEFRKFIFKTHIWYLDMFIRKMGWFKNKVYDERDGVPIWDLFNIHDVYLRGLFQDVKNFFDIPEMCEIFKKKFKLKDNSGIVKILKDINGSNSVSIHVRRGDLLTFEYAHVLSKSYYNKAINFIRKNVRSPVFYFFSDDIKWCKETFKDLKNCVFVEGNTVAEDFELMKNCKHNILANSTLSWWVGYLREDNGLVVCPRHFGTWKNNSRKELIYKKWVALVG